MHSDGPFYTIKLHPRGRDALKPTELIQVTGHQTLSLYARRAITILWHNAHQQGVEPGKDYFDFRPGTPLRETLAILRRPAQARRRGRIGSAGAPFLDAVEQMLPGERRAAELSHLPPDSCDATII